jgi:hypothetical protein
MKSQSLNPILWIALAACQLSSPATGPLGVSGHAIPPESICAYMVASLGVSAYGGEVFCAYEPLDAQQGLEGRLYLWVLCQEYVVQRGVIQPGSGISLPVVLLVQVQGGSPVFIGHRAPGDGEAYGPEVRMLFPSSTWHQITPQDETDIRGYNARADRLEQETERQAEATRADG